MLEQPGTAAGFQPQQIAWCELGLFHDGEFREPRHPCPANPDCNDGKDHYLRKRAAWVCVKCNYAYFTDRPPADHDCDQMFWDMEGGIA